MHFIGNYTRIQEQLIADLIHTDYWPLPEAQSFYEVPEHSSRLLPWSQVRSPLSWIWRSVIRPIRVLFGRPLQVDRLEVRKQDIRQLIRNAQRMLTVIQRLRALGDECIGAREKITAAYEPEEVYPQLTKELLEGPDRTCGLAKGEMEGVLDFFQVMITSLEALEKSQKVWDTAVWDAVKMQAEVRKLTASHYREVRSSIGSRIEGQVKEALPGVERKAIEGSWEATVGESVHDAAEVTESAEVDVVEGAQTESMESVELERAAN